MKKIVALIVAGLFLILTGCSRGSESTIAGKSASGTMVIQKDSGRNTDGLVAELSNFPVKYFPEGADVPAETVVKESDDPLIIADFGPDGELPDEIEYPSIWVLFSQPVVPLTMLGTPAETSQIMHISPPLNGIFRWYGTRLLSFEATGKGLPQHIYNISINDHIRSLGGKHLSGRSSFSFHTEYLSMESIVPGRGGVFKKNEVPVSEASRISISFNYPVNLEVISNYLQVSSAGINYDFTISRPEDTRGLKTKEELSKIAVLELSGDIRENSEIQVRMLKGAKSESNFIGTPIDEERSFKTFGPFAFVKYSTRSYSFPGNFGEDSNPVYLNFSHPVLDKDLSTLITSVPDLSIGKSNITVWKNVIKISNLPVEYNKSYIFNLSPDISDIYGRKLNKTNTVKVDIPEASSYAWFPNLGTHMLESSFDPKIVYEFQNISDGDWKVDSISDPYKSFDSSDLIPYNFTGIKKNVRHFEVMDLSPWLSSAGTGYVGLTWNFEAPGKDGKRPSWGKRDLQLEVTDLAITTRYGYNRVVALISSLSTGKVIPGATVSLMRDTEIIKQVTTDESGLAVFFLENGEYSKYFSDRTNHWKDHLRFRVKTDSDSIEFVPNNSHNIWHMGVYNVETPFNIQKPSMETLLFTDRGLYRPGETVTFRGIDRNLTVGDYTSFVGPYTIRLKEPSYTGKILQKDSGYTSESGGFYGTFKLPSNLAPGYYRLLYSRSGGSKQVSFQVANFERLSFSVDLKKPDIVYFPDNDLNFSISSSYLSGGALSSVPFNYAWTKTPISFRPDGSEWDGWTFGPGSWDQKYILSTGEGTLGPEGNSSVKQKPTAEGIKGLAYNYSVEVRVQDKSNQEVARRLSAIVHPASFYLALKLDSTGWSGFVEKGETVKVNFTKVDPEGAINHSNAEVKMELLHKTWKLLNQQGIDGQINTSYKEVEELETSSVLKNNTFEITPSKSGAYIVRLSSKDQMGRDVITNLPFYATGGDWIRWGRENTQDINLEPDKSIYKPGETAKLLLKSPLPEGQYLITTEREGIFDERVVFLKGGARVIGIPIEENYLPVVYVAVSSYSKRSQPPVNTYFEPDLDKPKGYFGITAINVDASSRSFDISTESDKSSYNPGDVVEMKIKTKFNGKPFAGAEITLMAVDRGVLDLINYHVPNPLKFFYSKDNFPLGTRGADSRSLLIDPVTYEVKDLQGGDSGGGKIDQRSDFNPTAVFEPFIITDSNGEAVVHFTLPDNLTTYRFTAIGVKDNKFGIKEGEIFARNPINVKSLVPGRLRFRDTTISGVSLTNLSDKDENVSIDVSSDFITVSGAGKVDIVVGAGKTEIVNFPLSASNIGKGVVNFAIRSNILNEDLHSKVIVEKPYVSETFTTAGQIGNSVTDRGNVKETLIIPSAAQDGIGRLDLTISPGFGGELKRAVEYLSEYPFNCFEQRSSKMIPKILFKKDDSEEYINKEISFIAKYQNKDGGIPFWPESGYRSSYYISLRVVHLLYLINRAGIHVEDMPDIDSLLKYINKPDKWVSGSNYLMAFRYYVSALSGEKISGASDLLQKDDEPSLTAYAMLGLAFLESGDNKNSDICLDRIKKFIKPGTRTIDFTETSEKAGFYESETETLSLLLMLLQKKEPQSELVMRVANTLSLRKRNGYWGNTADTAWAMLALSSNAGSSSVNFTAKVSLAGDNLASTAFSNRNDPLIERVFNLTEPPLNMQKRDTALPLSIEKVGPGSLFYTAALKYALPSEILIPRDEGIGLYSSVSNLEGHKVDPSKLTAGKTYIQKLIISSSRDREYLSVRVPVPSGARILDASFITSSLYAELETTKDNYWYNPPRREILDNEIRYFFDSFKSGKKEVKFYFRAQRPGVYPTPPIQAECMYQPEIFGRTAGKLIIIDEK